MIRRPATVLVLAAALAAVAAAPAGAADECRGLPVCVPVPGPWVAVPAGGSPPSARYELACPGRGRIVGGLDALVSDPAVEVTWSAKLGSPVNPGISTGGAATFTGLYAGAARRATAFRPFIGCIPTGGGGGRGTTAYRAPPPRAYDAAEPVQHRVVTVGLARGDGGVAVVTCPARTRLVGASAAVAFRQTPPPTAAALAGTTASVAVRDGRAQLAARRAAGSPPGRVEVQVIAVCTRP